MDNKKATSSNSNSGSGSKSKANGFLEQLSQYKLILIGLGIYIGYFYTQGYVSQYYIEKFSTNILWRPVAATLEQYVSTGLVNVLQAFLESLIAYAFLFGIYSIGQFLLNRFHWIIPRKITVSLLNGLCFCYFLFLPLFFKLFHQFFMYKPSYPVGLLWLWAILFFIVLLGGVILFLYQLKNVTSLQLKPFIKLFGLLFLITTIPTFTLFITYNGYLGFCAKVKFSLKDRKGMDYVRIYMTDGKNTEPIGYFWLSLTKDYFTGWDENRESINIIPINSIARIEKWHAVYVKKRFVQYSPGLTDTQIKRYSGLMAADVKDMLEVVQNFYTYRLGVVKPGEATIKPTLIDAGKILPLLTQRGKDNFFDPIFSPAILTQKWRQTKTFHTNKLSDFVGVDLSLPKKITTGKYIVFGHECWGDFEEQFLQFEIVKSRNNQWLINDIDNIDAPMRIREAK